MSNLNIDNALKIIPEFNGDQSHLHRFLACVDLIHDGLKDSEKPKLVKLLKAKLVGKAYDIVKYRDFEEWSELSRECNLQFSDHRSVEQLQTELVSIKQNKFEDVRSYGTRVQKLLSDLIDACVSCQGEDSADTIRSLYSKIALSSFLEGLFNGSIKLVVKACRFKTLREAIMQACEEEIISKSKPVQLSYKPNVSNIICHTCGKPGHISSKCYKNNNQLRERFQPSQVRTFDQICAYCKTKGHHISQCRKSKYYNANQTTTTTHPKNLPVPEQKMNTVARVYNLL